MATFNQFKLISTLDASLDAFAAHRRESKAFPAKVAAAENALDEALNAYAKNATNIDVLTAKIDAIIAECRAYDVAVGRRKNAEREYGNWLDAKRLFEAGDYNLKPIVDKKPASPESFVVPKQKPAPVGKDLVDAYLAECKRRFVMADKVKAALDALDAVKAAQAENEVATETAQADFSKTAFHVKTEVSGYERDEAEERRVLESQLAEIEAADRENAAKRDELKAKLGFFGKVAAKIKG